MPHSQAEEGRQVVELVATWGASALTVEGPLLEALRRQHRTRLGKRRRLGRARDLIGESMPPDLGARVRAVLEDPSGYATTDALELDLRRIAGEQLRTRAAALRADLAEWARHLSPEAVQSCWTTLWAPPPAEALEDALDRVEAISRARATLQGAAEGIVKRLREESTTLSMPAEANAAVQRALASAAPEDLARGLTSIARVRRQSEVDVGERQAKDAPVVLADRLRRFEAGMAARPPLPGAEDVAAEVRRVLPELEQRQVAPVAGEAWARALDRVEAAAERAKDLATERRVFVSVVIEHLARSSPALADTPELEGISEMLRSAEGHAFHTTLLEVLRAAAAARSGGQGHTAMAGKLEAAGKALEAALEQSGDLPVERLAQARLWLEQIDEPIAAGDLDRMGALLRAIEHETQALQASTAKARRQVRGRAEARREGLRERLEALTAVAAPRDARDLKALAARLRQADEAGEVAAAEQLTRLGRRVERSLRQRAARTLARAARAARPAAKLAEALRGDDLEEIAREEARLRGAAAR